MPPNNRSMPQAVVIPVLNYADVREAVEWLCRAFGFEERLRIGDHRSQLVFAEGTVIVTKTVPPSDAAQAFNHAVMVRVVDVDRHYEQAKRSGARIINPPTDYPYGERQYTVDDLSGHRWTFSQTIADIDPAEWGGVLVRSG